MRTLLSLAATLALAALASCQSRSVSAIPEARADQEPTPVPVAGAMAVVELFTSEGCSSCPPADGVLADLAASPNVLALSFHVDYWDDLGWPDRFASPSNTARQRAYSRALGQRGMYTPQMVVAGREQLVGSDREHADAAIARALAKAPLVTLALHPRRTGDDTIAVDYTASGSPAGAVLDVAVVERSISSNVRAGENSGKTLHHANVVRAFVTVPLAASGTAQVHVPAGLRGAGGLVIAYAQREADDGDGMPILGSTSAPLP